LDHLSIFPGTAGREQKNVLRSALLRIQNASSLIPSSCASWLWWQLHFNLLILMIFQSECLELWLV